MKTNNNFLKSIVYLALVFFAFSCEKLPEPEPVSQEPEMPPLTHIGANTFGCYIDGELFVANEGSSVWSIPAVSGSFNEESGYLAVQGRRYSEPLKSGDEVRREDIIFRTYVSPSIGKSELYIGDGGIDGYRDVGGDRCDYFYESNLDISEVIITFLNRESNIISGTFSMTLINSNCSEKKEMKITEGRFDFRY